MSARKKTFTAAAIAVTSAGAMTATAQTAEIVSEHFVTNINPSIIFAVVTRSDNSASVDQLTMPANTRAVNSTLQMDDSYHLLWQENATGKSYFWRGTANGPANFVASNPLPIDLFQHVEFHARAANSVSGSGFVVGSDSNLNISTGNTNIAKLDPDDSVIKTMQAGPTFYYNSDGSKVTKLPKAIGCDNEDNCFLLVQRNGNYGVATAQNSTANIWRIPNSDWSFGAGTDTGINSSNFEQSYASGWFLPAVSDTTGNYALAGFAASPDGATLRVVYANPTSTQTNLRIRDYRVTEDPLGTVRTPTPTADVSYTLPANSTVCRIRFSFDSQTSELFYQTGNMESALIQDTSGNVTATRSDFIFSGNPAPACVPVG